MSQEWIPEPWMALPFIGLLLAIAILPLAAPHFWHRARNQAIVSAVFSLPVIVFCLRHSPRVLWTDLEHYASFVILLGSLFIVSGGILLTGKMKSTPSFNMKFLGIGCALANLIGTTGASMVMIRPLLRANSHRKHHAHLPIFFIMLVSNIGGLLTPLGDPPLFLGFLLGVPFFWTLKLLPVWIFTVSILLAVFFLFDRHSLKKEPHLAITPERNNSASTLKGKRNFFCLAAIIFAVFIPLPYREITMIVAAITALKITPKKYREENGFNFAPILEVAILFLGIFITMAPALELLRLRGGELGVRVPWHFFWATGVFSSFLDNAPTYLTFVSLAQGLNLPGPHLAIPEHILRAISVGAVFFGANTYIGNAPNFMVRSISERSGWKMPSFFGYMLWSGAILIPLFLLITLVFFRQNAA